MKDKPRKLVSIGEFVRHLTSKSTHFAIGLGIFCVGLVALLSFFALACDAISEIMDPSNLPFGKTWSETGLLIIFGLVTLGLSCVYSMRLGARTVKEAVDMPAVRVATPKALAELPIEDVLVRASLAPSEDAGKTLLRATVASGETPAEELLRPL